MFVDRNLLISSGWKEAIVSSEYKVSRESKISFSDSNLIDLNANDNMKAYFAFYVLVESLQIV